MLLQVSITQTLQKAGTSLELPSKAELGGWGEADQR
jgi:hypothetical protein